MSMAFELPSRHAAGNENTGAHLMNAILEGAIFGVGGWFRILTIIWGT
jgi:hypothetical protein